MRAVRRFVPTRELILMVVMRVVVAGVAYEASLVADGYARTALTLLAHAAAMMALIGILGHCEKVFAQSAWKAYDLHKAMRAKNAERKSSNSLAQRA